MLKYTLEQLITGIYATFLLFCMLFIPVFYICGYLFESKREKIGKIYLLYKIILFILIAGYVLWLGVQ